MGCLGALLLLILAGFVILIMHASNGAQPTWLYCRDMRNRYGTPKKIDSRLSEEGHQPVKAESESSETSPPPKNS